MRKFFNREYLLLFLLAGIAALGFLFWGISSNRHADTEDGSVKLYYLNIDGTSLVSTRYHLRSDETDRKQITEELLEKLSEETPSADARRTLAADIACQGFFYSGNVLILDFPQAFSDLSRTDDVLIRAALVKTLTQAPETDYVMFTIDGKEMTRENGEPLGSFCAEDFLENPEAAINTSITTNVVLYVTDEEGTSLIPVSRQVTFSSSTPMEKVIMQQLILGTTTPGFKSTIPLKTQLISVSLSNGVCYVNLDETFRNDQSQDITEQVVLYSIVNSLTELDTVDQVQISVNGDNTGKVRYNYDLSRFYRMNNEIVRYLVEDTEELLPGTEELSTE